MTFRRNDSGVAQLEAQVAAKLLPREAQLLAREAGRMMERDTGHAQRSYKATGLTHDGIGPVAYAYTDDVAGHIFEWGSAREAPRAPLRRSAQRRGLRLRLKGKA